LSTATNPSVGIPTTHATSPLTHTVLTDFAIRDHMAFLLNLWYSVSVGHLRAPLTCKQGFIDSWHSLLDLPSLSYHIRGEARVQPPEYRLDIPWNCNRNAPWFMYDALLEPEASQIQRGTWPRTTGGVPSRDGAGRGGACTACAPLARPFDSPRRTLDRARARIGPIRHGHVFHLHVLLHVHRRRIQAYGSERSSM
jgi:hypothetical protein